MRVAGYVAGQGQPAYGCGTQSAWGKPIHQPWCCLGYAPARIVSVVPAGGCPAQNGARAVACRHSRANVLHSSQPALREDGGTCATLPRVAPPQQGAECWGSDARNQRHGTCSTQFGQRRVSNESARFGKLGDSAHITPPVSPPHGV